MDSNPYISMNTKISPLVSGGITALVTAILAVGATIGTLTVTTGTFTTATATTLAATTIAIGGGTAIDKVVAVTASIDPNSLGNGAGTSTLVGLSGAAVGDTVVIGRSGSWASPSSSVSVVGSVLATDVVTLYFQNGSSSAVNLTNSSYVISALSY